MSAWIVPQRHVDYLVAAGLELPGEFAPLRWAVPHDRPESDWQRGSAWGPTSVETYQQYRRELTAETSDEVGAMLILENVRSVAFRYRGSIVELDGVATSNVDEDGRDLPGPVDPYYTRAYRYQAPARRVDALVVLKAIRCYEYQSCEHPGWQKSEAFEYCDALRTASISALPGYDEANGWPIADVEPKPSYPANPIPP